jgi:hypothetical protein
MFDRVDVMAHVAADRPELADLLDYLMEEDSPAVLPFLLAPDLVRLIHSVESPSDVARIVLEFMQGLQIVAQIRYEDMEGLIA